MDRMSRAHCAEGPRICKVKSSKEHLCLTFFFFFCRNFSPIRRTRSRLLVRMHAFGHAVRKHGRFKGRRHYEKNKKETVICCSSLIGADRFKYCGSISADNSMKSRHHPLCRKRPQQNLLQSRSKCRKQLLLRSPCQKERVPITRQRRPAERQGRKQKELVNPLSPKFRRKQLLQFLRKRRF